jgi:hypothetical protein
MHCALTGFGGFERLVRGLSAADPRHRSTIRGAGEFAPRRFIQRVRKSFAVAVRVKSRAAPFPMRTGHDQPTPSATADAVLIFAKRSRHGSCSGSREGTAEYTVFAAIRRHGVHSLSSSSSSRERKVCVSPGPWHSTSSRGRTGSYGLVRLEGDPGLGELLTEAVAEEANCESHAAFRTFGKRGLEQVVLAQVQFAAGVAQGEQH